MLNMLRKKQQLIIIIRTLPDSCEEHRRWRIRVGGRTSSSWVRKERDRNAYLYVREWKFREKEREKNVRKGRAMKRKRKRERDRQRRKIEKEEGEGWLDFRVSWLAERCSWRRSLGYDCNLLCFPSSYPLILYYETGKKIYYGLVA